MASPPENGSDIDPNLVGAETQKPEGEKFETLSLPVPIEEGLEKITIVGAPLSVQENGNKDDAASKNESESESESDSESEDSDSESSAPDSGNGSSSDSSGSSGSEDEEEEPHGGDVEVEEGEISGSDEEKMVSWSMVDDDVDDVDGGDDVAREPIRSKNEIQDLPPVPPVHATLEPHHQMLPVGIVTSTLGAQVIVEGVEKHDPLNEGSILWLTESQKPLGLIDEIFGPVKNPFYIVRYNSESEVPAGIHGGTLISFVPEFAGHVLNNKDLYKKGYDASGAYDEELSDEVEFSDDEKEAEYKRMQRTTKRGINDQNPGKKKNNRKKVSPNTHVAPTIPDTPAAPFHDNGNHPPFSSIGQCLLGAATPAPPFPTLNTAPPNFAANGVWMNGTTLPLQPQPAMLTNGFPTNSIPWYPQNAQISPQLPMPGIPFQQQLHPGQGLLSTPMLPGIQPNILASMYAAGPLGQNQMAFGLNSSPFPQIQPPQCAVQQGFPSTEIHSGGNNFQSNPFSGASPQFQPGSSDNRSRKLFHGTGRKGWRPAK
ncbi:hypothetical protein RJT34_31216 [Clitoria ternatea]|uniref:H/ACA ribonucleoprotein complex non-core subunit NAF1 n=1 Tax=Clitoria ternatea TaxID=43366 RepID=A0AAN9EUX2_CLITE